MPSNKKQKIRKLLGLLDPESKTDLIAQGLEEEIQAIGERLSHIKDSSSAIIEIQKGLSDLKDNILLRLESLPTNESLSDVKKKYLEQIEDTKEYLNLLIQGIDSGLKDTQKDFTTEIKDIKDTIEEWRRDVIQRISGLGGGSMNRQIKVNNVDVLKNFTDINFIGSITAVSNVVTKATDITFTSGSSQTPWTSSIDGDGNDLFDVNNISANTFTGDGLGLYNISLATQNNDAGFITSESDTLSSVTGRGATTATQSTFSGGLLTSNVKGNVSGVLIDSAVGDTSLAVNNGTWVLTAESTTNLTGNISGTNSNAPFWFDSTVTVTPATASTITAFNSLKQLVSLSVATYPSLTELAYVKGVTSAIQTQIDGKQPLDSDLTTIAGLTATTNNIIQSVGSAWASRTPAQVAATLDHNSLTNLTVGDVHTQYALLTGRSGGQTLIGGTASGNNLNLQTTSNATKGKILFGKVTSVDVFDDVNSRWGFGVAAPTAKVDILGNISLTNSATSLVIEGGVVGNARGALATDVQGSVTATTVASGARAATFGYRNTASAADTVALGSANTATTADASSIGRSNGASGASGAAAIGYANSATGAYSDAIGNLNTAGGSGGNSAIGAANTVTATSDASAIGRLNSCAGTNGSAFGFQNTVGSGTNCVALGLLNTTGSSNDSLAFGSFNDITGAASFGFGRDNDTSVASAGMVGFSLRNTTASSLELGMTDATKIRIDSSGRLSIGLGNTAQTAFLHIVAGTATANTAPIKLTTGTKLTTAEAGVHEFDTNHYMTNNNAIRFTVGGSLSTNTTAVGNVGTGEDDLMTYSVAANTLSVNGGSIRFRASGTIANSINAKRLRVKFGGTTILDTGAAGFPVSTAIQWVLEGEIIRTGAATQKCSANLSTNNASLASYVGYSTAAETLSGAVTLKLTGEATTNDDIVQETMTVRFNPL